VATDLSEQWLHSTRTWGAFEIRLYNSPHPTTGTLRWWAQAWLQGERWYARSGAFYMTSEAALEALRDVLQTERDRASEDMATIDTKLERLREALIGSGRPDDGNGS
jgi:hypothetical protein